MNKLSLIILLVLFSCNISSEKYERKLYYKSGKIKSIQTLDTDSVRNGEYRIFHENGNLAQKGFYDEGLLQGELLFYSESGNLETKCNFENGDVNGLCYNYYPSGNLAGIINFKNGLKAGDGLLYFENGQLEAYIYYSDGEEVLYRRDYSESGDIVKEKGYVFPEKLILNDTLFNVGDTLEVLFRPVNPPNCQVSLVIRELNDFGELVVENSFDLNGESFLEYKSPLIQKGSFQLEAYIEFDCNTLLSKKRRSIEIIDFYVR